MGGLPRKKPIVLGPTRRPRPGDWGGPEPSPSAKREHELMGDWSPVDASGWSDEPPETPCPGPLVYHLGDTGFFECYGTCTAIKHGHTRGKGLTHCIDNGAIEKLEQQYDDPIQRCSACASADRPAAPREWLS